MTQYITVHVVIFVLRACKHITNSPVFGQLEWRSNGFLHHAETKHELAFGAWTSNRNSLLASMHNLSVSPRPPSIPPSSLSSSSSALWSVLASRAPLSVKGRMCGLRIVTPQTLPSVHPQPFFSLKKEMMKRWRKEMEGLRREASGAEGVWRRRYF